MATPSPNPDLEFSFPVEVTQLPGTGRDYTISAKEADRPRVAKRLDLLELPALRVAIHVEPGEGGLVHVTGRVTADVVQACVVTLAPVAASIAEDFKLSFTRAAAKTPQDIEIEAETDEDPPEPIHGDIIDLGEVAVEQLALLINPYPRAPGAVFKGAPGAPEEAPKATVSPFAVLAKLKTKS